MPIDETWWNPYRLLPSKTTDKIFLSSNEKFSKASFTGSIEAELTNLTLFFVGENKQDERLFTSDKKNIPFVSGTSLKGMIRSLAEYIIGDPPVVGDNSIKPQKDDKIPTTFNMFGFMGKDTILKGKVSFSDAKSTQMRKSGIKKNYLPGTPKKTHLAFYNKPDLRKFYFHMPIPNPMLKSDFVLDLNSGKYGPTNIEALQAGYTFKFNVYFENLSEKELSLLLYCLALENNLEKTIGIGEQQFTVKGDMAHKLGRAKSYGLGSVKIKINTLKLLPSNPSDRYKSYKDDQSLIYQDESLKNFITEKNKLFCDDKTNHMENLRKMMIFDKDNKTTFKYPSNNWFKIDVTEDGTRKSQLPLKNI